MYKIINSDVYVGLTNLIDNSIDLAVTSPPYWGQRDYGFDGQIGNEKKYQTYINKLVINFNVLRNKLTNEGVFFLNVGDKYISKYGKTPLGFIPYQLAYSMQKDGWFLIDTIIWYKPNHMPSSIKNRFTNSYEPVFVFAKSENNIYNQQILKTQNNSNVLKVPLQPTPFKHVAVYPERLVLALLKKVNLTSNATILDPFAGSGTTLKVVKEYYKTCSAIMIECNEDYIEIIKKRCNLNGEFEIKKYDFIPYFVKEHKPEIIEAKLFETKINNYNESNHKNGFVKIFDNKNDYYDILKKFKNQSIRNNYKNNATFFIGCMDFDIDLIIDTAKLNSQAWVIRNMVIIEKGNRWFPVFMIVDDNKLTKYTFNYKKLKLKSKNDYQRNWNETNFIGYKVLDSVSKYKNYGKVIDVLEKYENGFPKYLIVEWQNNTFTKEYVVFSQEEVNKNLTINTDNINFEIKENKILTSIEKNVFLKEKPEIKKLLCTNSPSLVEKYNGKFKNEKRINLGASPGARSSVDKEYFSLQRLYEVNQNLIVDYLNEKRLKKGLSKKELTNCFPPEYKHTVGHWLRKDFGGSLPAPEDWEKLTKIIDIDENMTNYLCKSALRIQTVKHAEFKMPNDFQKFDFIEKFKLLLF